MDAAKFYCQYDMKFGLCTALFFVKLTRAKVTWDKGTSNEMFCGSWKVRIWVETQIMEAYLVKFQGQGSKDLSETMRYLN